MSDQTGPGSDAQTSPHDAVFRTMLGEPVNAASQLRAVLPTELADRLDLDQLARAPGSFVDDAMRWRHVDLLFTVPFVENPGRDALVYVLVEHQSRTDPMMPLRMLRYMVRVWDQYVTDQPGSTTLPVVIPLVVHHNRRRWRGPTELADLFDIDDGIAGAVLEFLPTFRFVLDDLTVLDEAALRNRPVTAATRVLLLLLKAATSGDSRLIEQLSSWDDALRDLVEGPNGVRYFAIVLKYIEIVSDESPELLRGLARKVGPAAEEAYMTIADTFRAEGEVRGRAETLLQLLELKFGPLSQNTRDAVHAATTDHLEAWTARIFTADTVDDVLH